MPDAQPNDTPHASTTALRVASPLTSALSRRPVSRSRSAARPAAGRLSAVERGIAGLAATALPDRADGPALPRDHDRGM